MPLLVCPNCDEGMREVERRGVRIDVCPRCRGVWLDRGELEKLLETAADGRSTVSPPPTPPTHRRKRRSFLEDIFDFDLFD